MKKSYLPLFLILFAVLALFVALRVKEANEPEPTPVPTLAPTPEPTTVPTEEPIEETTPEPTSEPTPEPTPEATPEPDAEAKTEFHLSFAGDTTLGSLVEWQGYTGGDFQSTVGQNFAYPLQNVQSIFAADDFTMVNLEGTFTDSNLAVEKKYRFKAAPAYAQVLSEGSVEAVALANNPAGDLLDQGRIDTKAAVEAVGAVWADFDKPLIYPLNDGPKLGIVNYNTVEDYNGEEKWREDIQRAIAFCRDEGCDFIIGFMHWGSAEYLPEAEPWAVQLAHDMTDWGCGLIVGGHAHILQPMEFYHDVPIFSSMGNFCYGGHLNPPDTDSVILSVTLHWEDGSATLESVTPLPCAISSSESRNDYRPTLYTEDGAGYTRVMEKLKWSEEER